MNTKLLSIIAFVLIANLALGQGKGTVPSINIENLKGQTVSSSELLNQDGLTIITFWATWCKPCILELNELQDLYEVWQSELDVKLLAVSVDDARSSSKVPAFVNGKGWDFDVYVDKNSDLKRSLNINNMPHILLINSLGEIIWQHTGYTLGDEDVLYDELLKATNN